MKATIWNREETIWRPLPVDGSAFERLTLLGGGKRKEAELVLADGRRFWLAAGDVRLIARTGLTVQAASVDDVSLRIDYFGVGLVIRRARVGILVYRPDDRGDEEQFAQQLQAFLQSDGREELHWVVDFDLELAATSGG
ncbi:hypothetical protein [Actinoallomurus sp. CA-142502]|uniref:hypothetical protein n=1 Tax=Actinoallomurus sp. CA-142502 TaxID=3239885 RepID=UPI003D91B70C